MLSLIKIIESDKLSLNFSKSLNMRKIDLLTLLLKHITGHNEHPRVQQQQTQPQNSHLTFTGSVFLRTLLTRITVALNSSGATRDTNPFGNSDSNRLLRPNLQQNIEKYEYWQSIKIHHNHWFQI